MPIGAKMYEQAAKDEKPAEDVAAEAEEKSSDDKDDKKPDDTVEGEVIDDKDKK